jgi:hypothetical protein
VSAKPDSTIRQGRTRASRWSRLVWAGMLAVVAGTMAIVFARSAVASTTPPTETIYNHKSAGMSFK